MRAQSGSERSSQVGPCARQSASDRAAVEFEEAEEDRATGLPGEGIAVRGRLVELVGAFEQLAPGDHHLSVDDDMEPLGELGAAAGLIPARDAGEIEEMRRALPVALGAERHERLHRGLRRGAVEEGLGRRQAGVQALHLERRDILRERRERQEEGKGEGREGL